MKRILIVFIISLELTAVAEAGPWPPWSEFYRDDIESLALGPVNGQYNSQGQLWTSYDATVQDVGGNQFISQTNTFADGFFYNELSTTLPPVSGYKRLTVDVTLSDLRTARFFTPVDGHLGQVFTRVGDANHDGFWEVLQLDGSGNPYYALTNAAIPLTFTLQILLGNPDLEVTVNGMTIFTGTVLDTGPFGGPGLSQDLTAAWFESGNNVGGFGSVATYDNVVVYVPDPASCLLLMLPVAACVRRCARHHGAGTRVQVLRKEVAS